MHVQRCNHSGFKKSSDYIYIHVFHSKYPEKVNTCSGVNIQNLIDLNNYIVTSMSKQINLKYCGFIVIH